MSRLIQVRIRKGSRFTNTMSWMTIDLDRPITEQEVDKEIGSRMGMVAFIGLAAALMFGLILLGLLIAAAWLPAFIVAALVAALYKILAWARGLIANSDREDVRKSLQAARAREIDALLRGDG